MNNYILRRVLQGVPTFFGVTIIAFLLTLSTSGDPVALITFNQTSSDPEVTEGLHRKLGVDQPAYVQYIYWLIGNDWRQVDSDGDIG